MLIAGDLNPLLQQLSGLFSALPQVKAVALGGSRVNLQTNTDNTSDIDLYVFTTSDIPLEQRQQIVEISGGASRAEMDLNYWGPNDTWFHLPSGMEIDINYFDANWMEEQIDRVLVRFEPGMGYTTCFWHTIRNSFILSDLHGWLVGLQTRCAVDYPDALRQNIIAYNHPLLRGIIPAYAHQLEKAANRGDLVSLNHRLAALLASYFDIIFALNRLTHPGEKRLLEQATATCTLVPENMSADVEAVLRFAVVNPEGLEIQVTRLLNHLDDLLHREGIPV